MADNKGKGLEGVVAARTSISDIDGQQGKLFYAGYDIADLAEHSTFEETVYLLHHLALPTRAQLDEENAFLRSEQRLDPALVRLISSLGDGTNPMTVLRTVVSAAAALDPTVDDESSEANLRKAYKLVALTPRIVAAFHRLRTGGDAGRHVRGRDRRHRHAAGAAPRRRDRAGPLHARRDPHARPGRRLRQAPAGRQAEGDGVRPPRLQDLGPARPDPARDEPPPRRAARRHPLVRDLRPDPADGDGG